jgi:O-methyltransferase involved in polyketide biosynthesis
VRENAKLVEQIVLLGAGLDARAYRTQEIKHCTVFEIDRQEVLEYKARILKKFEDQMLCRKVVRVVGDLKESKKKFRKPKGNGNSQKPQGPFWEDLLLDAGFDPLKPTIWIAEGLLMYLDKNEVQGLLQSMADISQANSLLIGDIVNSATLKSKYYWYRIFRWGCDRKNLSDTLRIFRWKVLSAEEIGKDGISYGRYLADPLYLSEEQFPSLSEEERKLETFMAVAEVVPKRKHFPASECKENTI